MQSYFEGFTMTKETSATLRVSPLTTNFIVESTVVVMAMCWG
jgi:hypothetical protein